MKKTSSVSISILLVVAIGGLVALATGAVLLITSYANYRNTSELVVNGARNFMELLETDVRTHLQPARNIVEHLTREAEQGNLDPALRQESTLLLSGALAGVPQVTDIGLIRPDGQQIFVSTSPAGRTIVESGDVTQDPEKTAYLDRIRQGGKLVWNPPYRLGGRTLVSVIAPMFHEGRYVGAVAAGVSVERLSQLVSQFNRLYQTTGLILYGRDRVLAHAGLIGLTTADLDVQTPLHTLSALADPVMARFHETTPLPERFSKTFEVREIRANGNDYIALSRTLDGFGDQPWTLVAYSPASAWTTQIERLDRSIIGGILLLVLAIVAAIYLAKRIARPIRLTAGAASRIGALDLDGVKKLPPSHITELNNQAEAFNHMVDALKWFQTYLPKQLVQRLIGETGGEAVVSREEVLTVMFTDIIGFTAMSETKDAAEIAGLLNRHFEILNRCIEAEGGTLDKYIGDSVMAFWGAPERQEDHAARACRTALAISDALANEPDGLRVKIAIHTGPLVVGNIGAQARMNYTVIGDTVNTCSRIETLAGQLDDGSPASILVSGETLAQLSDGFELEDAGTFAVKGRSKAVDVHRLRAAPGNADANTAGITT